MITIDRKHSQPQITIRVPWLGLYGNIIQAWASPGADRLAARLLNDDRISGLIDPITVLYRVKYVLQLISGSGGAIIMGHSPEIRAPSWLFVVEPGIQASCPVVSSEQILRVSFVNVQAVGKYRICHVLGIKQALLASKTLNLFMETPVH